MTVHFIGAGPGAPDLITLRGRDLLARCPVCLYAGSLVPRALLDHCPPGARVVDTAPLDLDAIAAEFAMAHAAGLDVARLHSGDLSVWSAMGEQLRRLKATLAIHLSIHALDRVVADLLPIHGAEMPVAVVVRASWPEERVVRGTLGTIMALMAAEPAERTALILVGRALNAERFRDSALYDADYRRRFRGGVGP